MRYEEKRKDVLMEKQTCKRCIQDTTVPGLIFDSSGVCNFCHFHDQMETEYPNDQRGEKKLNSLMEKLKKSSQKYHCVLGISGGRDSTFLLWLLVKKWKLKPLAVPVKNFKDYSTSWNRIQKAKPLVKILSQLNILPKVAYRKYFQFC